METWGEIAQRIYKGLNENGYKYLVDKMIDEYGIGDTRREMFSIFCTQLAKMRNTGNPAFDLVKEDTQILLNYAIELKYFT